jgi:hypothetical protein
VVDVLDSQIEFILIALGCTAVFGAAISEHPIQRIQYASKERQHSFIDATSVAVTGVFAVIEP